jgi:hypothetical protein
MLFTTFYAVVAVDAAQLGALEAEHIVGEAFSAAAAREPRIDMAAVGEARVLYVSKMHQCGFIALDPLLRG